MAVISVSILLIPWISSAAILRNSSKEPTTFDRTRVWMLPSLKLSMSSNLEREMLTNLLWSWSAKQLLQSPQGESQSSETQNLLISCFLWEAQGNAFFTFYSFISLFIIGRMAYWYNCLIALSKIKLITKGPVSNPMTSCPGKYDLLHNVKNRSGWISIRCNSLSFTVFDIVNDVLLCLDLSPP